MAMKSSVCFFALLVCAAVGLPINGRAQFDDVGKLPIEINADGETTFEGGLAKAANNVAIRFGEVSIYCDRAQYNPDTKDVLLEGNVRLYKEGELYVGEKVLYNFETKAITADAVKGGSVPFFFTADTMKSADGDAIFTEGTDFTTHDSSKPDFRWRAKRVRIYPDDRVIFSNVTWYVGKTPVFWFPYMYQSLDDDTAFSLSPGYDSRWGAYLLTQYTFPIGEKIGATAHLDLRSEKGVAVGLDGKFRYGANDRSKGIFRSYFINDSDPDSTESGEVREGTEKNRYRIALQHRAYITDDIYANVNINKLSDEYFLEDFFLGEFQLDPQPDNVVSLTKWDEKYTLTAIARAQLNDFFETTERLPEIALDITRQELGKTGIFYEGETTAAHLERRFADDSEFPDYDANRLDTFHQFVYPKTIGGWLSVVPRAGFRLTYYDNTGSIEEIAEKTKIDPETGKAYYAVDPVTGKPITDIDPETGLPQGTPTNQVLNAGGSDTRAIFNLGLETSFKFSKTWDNVQSRAWGLDGLRHIVQPYMNLSYVSDPSLDPEETLQFDRLIPSTQLNPIDFPQFNTIDSIDQWTIWRVGVRQRLQTRRGDATFNWLELDSYAEINIENPYDDTDVSNFFNRLSFRPLPWLGLEIDSQIPAFDDGFTEVNTMLNVQPIECLGVSIGHRYLDDNPFFENSSLGTLGIYWRVNDHWAVSLYEQYEFEDSTMESQSITLHRDLTSWVASLGAVVRDNGEEGEDEFAFLLTFTLKELPQLSFPFGVDQGQGGGSGLGGRSRY
jgi:hypothetical protein